MPFGNSPKYFEEIVSPWQLMKWMRGASCALLQPGPSGGEVSTAAPGPNSVSAESRVDFCQTLALRAKWPA